MRVPTTYQDAEDRAISRDHALTALSDGEHLLVWTWRRIVGGGGCPLIEREFSRLCGEDAAEVLTTLWSFLLASAHGSRRRLQIGYPGYPGLTGDERQFLTMIAAAQTGDEACLAAHLRWIARPELSLALAIATRALGTALEVHGLRLPSPSVSCSIASAGAAHL